MSGTFSYKTVLLGTVAAAIALVPSQVFARSAMADVAANDPASADAASNKNPQLEEIVVTAQRREQSLQDVPISVSAFTSEQIEKQNIRGTADYLIATPNVNFTEDAEGGRRGLSLSIRGVSNLTDAEVSSTNAFATYIDDLNVAASATVVVNPQLGDIERIEVLRGPQGTLFGRNASGGALNITTKKPVDDLYAEVSAFGERFGHFGLSGVANVPLNRRIFARVVAGYEQGDGEIKNVSGRGKKGADFHTLAVRAGLRFLLTDTLTADLGYSFADEKQDLDNNVPTGVLATSALRSYPRIYGRNCSPAQNAARQCAINEGTGFYPENGRKTSKDYPEINNNKMHIANLRLTWDLDKVVLRSITGYTDSTSVHNFDLDGTAESRVIRFKDRDANSFSQEVRADVTLSDALRFTTGAMYANEEFSALRAAVAGTLGFIRTPSGGVVSATLDTFQNKSWAAFADATWSLSDSLEVIGGLRYSKDKITVGFSANPPAAPADEVSSTFDDVSGRAVLNFRPNKDILLYASYATAYKAGGSQLNDPAGAIAANTPFNEEKVRSIELGAKTSFFNNRLQLNAAMFFIKWDDLQVETQYLAVDAQGRIVSTTLTQNATSADSKGFEVDITARPLRDVVLGGSVGYMDAKFGRFDNALIDRKVADVSGLPLPQAPKLTLSAFAEYRTSISSVGQVFARAEYRYRSEATANLEGVARRQLELPDFPFLIPSFDVVNIRAGIETDGWKFMAYVENLFDKHYYTGTREDFSFSGVKVRPHFRVFGAKLTKVF